MSFNIGDRVILIGTGPENRAALRCWVGHWFTVESVLKPWASYPDYPAMHQIGPPPPPYIQMLAQPQYLMKIDPDADEMQEISTEDLAITQNV